MPEKIRKLVFRSKKLRETEIPVLPICIPSALSMAIDNWLDNKADIDNFVDKFVDDKQEE